jgi:hypothetical protein
MSRALREAIALFRTPTALARAIDYSQHAVWVAIDRGSVTPRMAMAIERATKRKGKMISRERLCPLLRQPKRSNGHA